MAASRSRARAADEGPSRARSGDLTGEREGREPASQDEPAETVEAAQQQISPQEEVAVPVDVALDVEDLDANLFRSKVSGGRHDEFGTGDVPTDISILSTAIVL